MSEQRGARWLAREQREIGAATSGDDQPSTGQHHVSAGEPPRYPLADCMGDRASVEWWLILREFGVVDNGAMHS